MKCVLRSEMWPSKRNVAKTSPCCYTELRIYTTRFFSSLSFYSFSPWGAAVWWDFFISLAFSLFFSVGLFDYFLLFVLSSFLFCHLGFVVSMSFSYFFSCFVSAHFLHFFISLGCIISFNSFASSICFICVLPNRLYFLISWLASLSISLTTLLCLIVWITHVTEINKVTIVWAWLRFVFDCLLSVVE